MSNSDTDMLVKSSANVYKCGLGMVHIHEQWERANLTDGKAYLLLMLRRHSDT